eukprot:7749550-Alexandrium_andersonii.AAC.1
MREDFREVEAAGNEGQLRLGSIVSGDGHRAVGQAIDNIPTATLHVKSMNQSCKLVVQSACAFADCSWEQDVPPAQTPHRLRELPNLCKFLSVRVYMPNCIKVLRGPQMHYPF